MKKIYITSDQSEGITAEDLFKRYAKLAGTVGKITQMQDALIVGITGEKINNNYTLFGLNIYFNRVFPTGVGMNRRSG